MQVLFVDIHVTQAVNGDQPAHHGDDDHHDQGQAVGREGGNRRAVVHEHGLEVDQAYQLQGGHAHDQAAAQLPAQGQNVEQQDEIEQGQHIVQGQAEEFMRLQMERAMGSQPHRRKRHDGHGRGHQQFSDCAAADIVQHYADDKRQDHTAKNKNIEHIHLTGREL